MYYGDFLIISGDFGDFMVISCDFADFRQSSDPGWSISVSVFWPHFISISD